MFIIVRKGNVLNFFCTAIFYLLSIVSVSGQSIQIKVDGLIADRVILQSYYGSNLVPTDTIPVEGEAIFLENKNYQAGLYRLVLEDPANTALFKTNPSSLDFIISAEDISLHTSFFDPVKSMEVIHSKENSLFYDYLKKNNIYQARLGALLGLLSEYSEKDHFYEALGIETVRLQEEFVDYLLTSAGDREYRFISDYLKFMVEPVYHPDCGMSIGEFMKTNYLDPLDFNSPDLIRSPAISRKIISYLSFYANNKYSQAEQEVEFMLAVDKIMEEVSHNQEVRSFVLDFLVEGFEDLQMENVLVYIADNHLSADCETDNEKILQKRLAGYQEMSVGKPVKNIQLLNEQDELVSLFDIQKDYTLILFWASWCPHCKKLISDLNKWYKTEAQLYDIEIFAVSIDTSKADWEEVVFINDLSWINTLEPKGWDAKVSQQYNLYATPTMFLIDREKKIVAKPLTMREFLKVLKGLF
ncbi:MAG: TlpA family protein disulfide reductase [Bacteroidales bacterium]|nr:TlpA family protein disulfide reductase [Bacteroidales bacterium]MCF8391596.1 TlpA family protein disulfide reductase [Bacteroidales bacterium]